MMIERHDLVVKITHNDNVGIVVDPMGLEKDTVISGEVKILENVPMGHKVALRKIAAGEEVIRYGHTIAYANQTVPPGSWVNETNIAVPAPPSLDTLELQEYRSPTFEPLPGYSFEGYRNQDGSVGTKNVLAITTSVQCVAGVVEFVVKKIKEELLPRYPNVDDVVGLSHSFGCGIAIDAPAAIIPIRTLQNIAVNPNFGGEVLVIGLGCEKLRPERLFPSEVEVDRAQPLLFLQDPNFMGFSDMVKAILQMAERHLKKLNQRRRESCPAADLVVGMQCGGSDAFSGITANPVAGYAADLIVRSGGSVLFSEVTEIRDAVHLLLPRCSDQSVAKALIREVQWYDEYLRQGNADRSANPSPGNKQGGLSTIVEKSLGSIAKSGHSSIVDVLSPGERIRKKGLSFAATPASDFVCGTLQLAAGMNMHLFMTGRGTPYGLASVPVVKVASNSSLSARWHDLIDFDAGPVASGDKTIEELGWDLFHFILEVASGRKKVACDRLGLHNDLVLFNPGPLT